jgi:hypothetical protein
LLRFRCLLISELKSFGGQLNEASHLDICASRFERLLIADGQQPSSLLSGIG